MHELDGDQRLEGWFEERPPAPPVSRGLPILAGALVFLLVLLAGAIAGADWAARNLELRSLVAAIEESEDAMGTAQDEVIAAYTGAQQGGPASGVEDAAAAGRDAIAAAGLKVAAVRIAPWHVEVIAARDAYLRHNRSWQDYLDRTAKDVEELGRPQAEVDESFAAAEPLLRHAVPPAPLFDLVQRTNRIFAPSPGPGEVSA